MGRAGGICLLNDQLSAFVEALQGARNGECQEQSYQSKYGALDRGQPRHVAGLFLEISQPEASSVVQQDQRADEEGGSDRQRKKNEDHLQFHRTIWNSVRPFSTHSSTAICFAYLRPKEISEGDARRGADRCAANRTAPSVQRFPRATDSISPIV